MKLYKELYEAIEEIVSSTEESNVFKSRFSKLIENYFENSYTERDINDVIELIEIPEEHINGN